MTIIKEECTNQLRWLQKGADDLYRPLPTLQQKWLVWHSANKGEKDAILVEPGYFDGDKFLDAVYANIVIEWRNEPVVEE